MFGDTYKLQGGEDGGGSSGASSGLAVHATHLSIFLQIVINDNLQLNQDSFANCNI